MNHLYNPQLTANAQTLRKSMTKEERRLWYDFLKPSGINAHRQKALGLYIVDFYIASAKVIIELDGSQHYEEEGIRKDRERDTFLKANGFSVLRYSNADINENFDGVCEDILKHLSSTQEQDGGPPHQSSASRGIGG